MSEAQIAGRDYNPATIAIVAALIIGLGALLLGLLEVGDTQDMAFEAGSIEDTSGSTADERPEQSATGTNGAARQVVGMGRRSEYATRGGEGRHRAGVVGVSEQPP